MGLCGRLKRGSDQSGFLVRIATERKAVKPKLSEFFLWTFLSVFGWLGFLLGLGIYLFRRSVWLAIKSHRGLHRVGVSDRVAFALVRLVFPPVRSFEWEVEKPTPSVSPWEFDTPSISDELFRSLLGSIHLFVIGHTGGGKTTLLHELGQRWLKRGAKVVVFNSDAAKGQWPGCTVFGFGDDFEAMKPGLWVIKTLFKRRSEGYAQGQRNFKPFYWIIDEADKAFENVPEAIELAEDFALRGRKRGLHVVIGVGDKNLSRIKFTNAQTRKHFKTAELTFDSGVRSAIITERDDKSTAITIPIPVLPNIESLIEVSSERYDESDILASLLTNAPLPPVQVPVSVEQFINERIVEGVKGEIGAGILYVAFKEFGGVESSTAFGIALTKAGFTKTKSGSGRIVYLNIALKEIPVEASTVGNIVQGETSSQE